MSKAKNYQMGISLNWDWYIPKMSHDWDLSQQEIPINEYFHYLNIDES